MAAALYCNVDQVFVRELISNSSDALNKLRSAQVAGEADGALPLGIDISTQPDDGTITIADTGIGMTKVQTLSDPLQIFLHHLILAVFCCGAFYRTGGAHP